LNPSEKPIKFALIADTHIPDHMQQFPKGVLDALKRVNADRILHAGDISSQRVIDSLNKIAPVTAVQGNRDWFFRLKIDPVAQLDIYGQHITLSHGHGTIQQYLWDKVVSLVRGYRLERYQKMLSRAFPESRVIIFGHTHVQIAKWIGNRLFINPGSIYPCRTNDFHPEYGILTITPEGDLRTTLHRLS
jgi:hypothetical protein